MEGCPYMNKQVPAKRPKILELDAVRAWAIIGVVLIHSTSDAVAQLRKGSTSQLFFYMLNQGVLNQFAVPAFILISGLVLFYRYFDGWSLKDVPVFYGKRIWSAFVPLLVWSFFYYIVDQWIYAPQVVLDLRHFNDLIWWGDAKYHLYFLVIIIQFYLLFPLLISLAKWKSWTPHLLIPLGLVVQGAYYLTGFYYSDRFGPALQGLWFLDLHQKPSNAPNYFAVFLTGAYMGIYYRQFVEWTRQRLVLLLLLSAATIAAYCTLLYQADYAGNPISNHWFVALRLLFSVVFTGCLIILARMLQGRPRWSAPLVSLGKASFAVYLIHPLFLNLYDQHVRHGGSIASYDLYVAGKFAAGLGLSWLAGYLYSLLRRKKRPGSPLPVSGGADG